MKELRVPGASSCLTLTSKNEITSLECVTYARCSHSHAYTYLQNCIDGHVTSRYTRCLCPDILYSSVPDSRSISFQSGIKCLIHQSIKLNLADLPSILGNVDSALSTSSTHSLHLKAHGCIHLQNVESVDGRIHTIGDILPTLYYKFFLYRADRELI